jgi:hypothetical protein
MLSHGGQVAKKASLSVIPAAAIAQMRQSMPHRASPAKSMAWIGVKVPAMRMKIAA